MTTHANSFEQLTTLFALGREVASVLDLEELLQKIPQLIARLTKFNAFAVYLLDTTSRRAPDRLRRRLFRRGRPLAAIQGRRGPGRRRGGLGPAAARETTSMPSRSTSRRCPDRTPSWSCRCAARAGSSARCNLLSETKGQFTEADEAMLRQFAAHVSVAIENARLFEQERQYASTLETLAEVGREFGAILQLDELLTRITNLTRRVIDYRTFGIMLLNEDTNELEMKVAVRYGDKVQMPRVQLGVGLVGYAALHKEAVVVP
jgi:sigma-B regulation protein RsbU (phosphoserine phosphatase)